MVHNYQISEVPSDPSEVLNGRRPRADARLINDLFESTQHCESAGKQEAGEVSDFDPLANSKPVAASAAGALPASVTTGKALASRCNDSGRTGHSSARLTH
ncbi:MAG: hypothetical protein IT430_04210 [Phycisphaerales bacterium]|nr:hypothetical protein [Phycisphaerales bacterium]